jgi:hypothetical protein
LLDTRIASANGAKQLSTPAE